MFKGDAAYSAVDDTGIPTLDAQGQPIAKSLRKKLEKMHAAQATLYDKYNK